MNKQEMMDDKKNLWDSLPPPFDAILLHAIIPPFLTVKDFLQLSRVSKRYQVLLNPSSSSKQSYHPLREILKREYGLLEYHKKTFVEQPPSFRTAPLLKIIQEEDPWCVVKLHRAALRRRRLVVLTNNPESLSSSWKLLNPIIQECKPIRARRSNNNVVPRHLLHASHDTRTKFVCINESNVNIYCHWIDYDGQVLSREGDLIPPATTFHHTSQLSHSFLLCWEEPQSKPFAIYQQRRCWFSCNKFRHLHAIKVFPNGSIQELYGNMDMEYNRLRLYHPERLQPANVHDDFPSRIVNLFCGTFVPKIEDPVWKAEPLWLVTRCAGMPTMPAAPEEKIELTKWLQREYARLMQKLWGKQELLSFISVHQRGEEFWRDIWSHLHPL